MMNETTNLLPTPSRVLVSRTGRAVPFAAGRMSRHAPVAVIFERADGYSLGAPAHLARAAEAMWSDEWTRVYEGPTWMPIPYAEWRAARQGGR